MLTRGDSSDDGREPAIDFAKGFLVLVMLLYHCASVTHGSRFWQSLRAIPERIAFVHFAFVAASGYVCAIHYAPRMARESRRVRKRLLARGSKLIALMLLLNLAVWAAGGGAGGEELRRAAGSFGGVMREFVLNVKGSLVAFEILYYIGLFLVFAAVVLGRLDAWMLAGLAAAILVLGPNWTALKMVAIGLAGLAVGLLANAGSLRWLREIVRRTRGGAVVGLFLPYQCFLEGMRALAAEVGLPWACHLLETALWFLVILVLFDWVGEGWLGRGSRFLGRYTLFGYLAQMAIARAGWTLFGRLAISSGTYYMLNVTTSLVILLVVVWVTDRLRKRVPALDAAYRLVFE